MGDHPEEWFGGRGPLAMAVVDEMKAVGAYVFAGGLEEDGPVHSAGNREILAPVGGAPFSGPSGIRK